MYLFVSYEIITTFAPQNFLLINIKQRFMNNYETVFILTPVLSDAQMKEAVEKFTNLLKAQGAEIVNEENWGLRKLNFLSGLIMRNSNTYMIFMKRRTRNCGWPVWGWE